MDRLPIIPSVSSRKGITRQEAIGGESGYPDGANTFIANSFVVLTAGALVAVATDGVLACGFVPDASKPTTVVDPPNNFFGDRHWPFNLEGMRFRISVTDGSGNFGEANGAPQQSDVTLGDEYGIYLAADGSHQLNVDETTDTLLRVVELPEEVYTDAVISGDNSYAVKRDQDGNTYNPVVIVEVIPSKIQSLG